MIVDIILTPVVRWIQNRREKKEFRQAEQFTEDTANGFWALYHHALTWHGRHQLSNIINSVNEGDLEIDPKVLGMYQLVLSIAPYKAYATIN